MALRTFDVAQAVPALWDSRGLDEHFTEYWTNDQKEDFLVLMDEEASADQAWPYCAFESVASVSLRKSSGSTPQANRQEQNEDTLRFHVFAKDTPEKSSKLICSELVEEILKVYGGSTEGIHQDIPLQNGKVISQDYRQTILRKEGDEVWKATVIYSVTYELSLKD